MIFQHTWEKVISGEKTQTRRRIKNGETLISLEHAFGGYKPVHVENRNKPSLGSPLFYKPYIIGSTYAVQTARTHAALWISPQGKAQERVEWRHDTEFDWDDRIDHREWFEQCGYREARIRITNIRREDVRKISPEDARAEGFVSRTHFWLIWTKMHDLAFYNRYPTTGQISLADETGKLSERPDKFYQAWVLTFEVVK